MASKKKIKDMKYRNKNQGSLYGIHGNLLDIYCFIPILSNSLVRFYLIGKPI